MDWETLKLHFALGKQGHWYWQVAATSIALYDHLTTLDLEVELIWKKKVSVVQLLFILNRYSGDALFLHGTAYQLWLKGDAFTRVRVSGVAVQTWLSMIGLWSMQGIIIHRIWCMYRRSKKVLALLVCTFLAQVATSTTIIALDKGSSFHDTLALSIGELNLCMFNWENSLPWYWAYLVFIIAFDCIIFSLAFVEGLRFYRQSRGGARCARTGEIVRAPTVAAALRPLFSDGSLLRVLLRDSILFPFLGLIISIFTLLAWIDVLPVESTSIPLVLLSALASPVLGSRLVLNLRDAYYKPFADEVNSGLWQVEQQIRFSSRRDLSLSSGADSVPMVVIPSCHPSKI